ncbi:uncharacterized protein NEMAJ01_1210 [Nematocida major]|uniref:uncharacterized protein n=1 Tax=Nematocida major TaxID=1912982 RepID=UPI002007C968|nr:uncharacterized protein NEMAJ01_1210 [Nematocida major]KAH9386314.1 hypothetical protein NEMAJ01_1210 [Nematocida major]
MQTQTEMDPPVASISTERFTALWEIFQVEANKLASGISCSGMKIYTAIYQIVSGGDISYSVRLHWCIGKFFFAFCVSLRERIQGDNWVEEYVRAFCKYERTVETIDLLCLHLNEAIIDNKECKNVKDLGYVIWERCILRQRYENKLPALFESLPERREFSGVCLRSLSKIVTNSKNRLEYYKNNYEAGLLAGVVRRFNENIRAQKEPSLAAHLANCSRWIAMYKQEYSSLLLPISLPVLEEVLEKVVFTKHAHVLKDEILRILNRKNPAEIKELCSAVRPLRKKVFPAFLLYIEEFSNSVWPEGKSCAVSGAAYREILGLLSSSECEQTEKILASTLSARISRAGIGKELSDYVEALVAQKNLEEIKIADVLLKNITIKEEREMFCTAYVQKLSERLFSLKFDPSTERVAAESLSLPWVLKKKVRRIFDDMVQSTKENEHFRTLYGMENFKYITPASNEIFFYCIVTTACVWPIPEEAMMGMRLPPEMDAILSAFSGQYLEKNPKRRLSWVEALSTIEIEFETDRRYCMEMPLAHYTVLAAVEKEPAALESVMAAVGLSTKSTVNILESLQSISIVRHAAGLYFFNDSFTSTQQKIKLCPTESSSKRAGNRKPYYQAWISKTLKHTGECALDALMAAIQNAHTTIFDWNMEEYADALRSLSERGLVEIVDSTVRYLP